MEPNPFLGVTLHAVGGLAAASFYLPYTRVRGWSWETYWITGGVFSWLVAPIVFGLVIVSGFYGVPIFDVLRGSPWGALGGAYGFGVLWGIGGLTFGLSMRYLGIALGYAIALGFSAAFGTLAPPMVEGSFGTLLGSTSGLIVLGGVVTALVGIAFSGAAGMGKERELSPEQKQAVVAEFNFGRGLIIATVCGLLSACMAFALAAGDSINRRAIELGTPALWAGLPALVVILLGGLTTNAAWCFLLLAKNRRFGQFISVAREPTTGVIEATEPEREAELSAKPQAPRLLRNYVLSALAGTLWYLQFFFYTMGSSKMGERFGFSSWTLHMASIIIFSTFWGMLLKEWRGTSRRTHMLIALGLLILILSTIVVGYGNYVGAKGGP